MKSKMTLWIFVICTLTSFSVYGQNKTKPEKVILYPIYQYQKYGYMDATGKVIIPMQYAKLVNNSVCEFENGIIPVAISSSYDNEEWIYITKDNKNKYRKTFLKASLFENGTALVKHKKLTPKRLFQVDSLEIIDLNGKPVIPAGLNLVSNFQEERAIVKNVFDYGYINPAQEEVIPTKFSAANNFANGVAICTESENYKRVIIDKTGKIMATLNVAPNSESEEGDEVIQFSEGLLAVHNDKGMCGYMNTAGKIVIPLKFVGGNEFSNGLAAVATKDANGKTLWGYSDKKGKLIIPAKYDNVGDFCEGMSIACINKKWGIIDKKGAWIIEPKYTNYPVICKNGLIRLVDTYSWSYIDKTGKVIYEPTKSEEENTLDIIQSMMNGL